MSFSQWQWIEFCFTLLTTKYKQELKQTSGQSGYWQVLCIIQSKRNILSKTNLTSVFFYVQSCEHYKQNHTHVSTLLMWQQKSQKQKQTISATEGNEKTAREQELPLLSSARRGRQKHCCWDSFGLVERNIQNTLCSDFGSGEHFIPKNLPTLGCE